MQIPFAQPGITSSAYGLMKTWGFTLVRIFTDTGIVGIGGQVSHWPGGEYFSSILNKVMKPLLTQKLIDPQNIRQFSAYLKSLPPSSNLSPRPSSVEIALWDIAGKRAGQPVYKLLGARQDKVMAYINATTKLPRWEPAEIARFATKCLERGFRAIKTNMYSTSDIERDLECVRSVRNAVGDEMQIMVDGQATTSPYGKRRFSYREALKIAHELEKLNCFWLEDILPSYPTHELCRQLAAEVEIPIASGEELFGAEPFDGLMKENALDVVLPDVMYVGGISELLKVSNLAEINGKICSPHTGYCPGLVTAATLQAAGCTEVPYVEYILEPYATIDVRDSILMEPIEVDKEGYLRVPQKPGIGVELNEDNVRKFTVSQSRCA